MNLVYLFGPPGAGKSTLMAALTAGCARFPMDKPFAHDLLIDPTPPGIAVLGIELGRSRAAFPGTDALSFSVCPLAKGFLAGQPSELILGEGDRLAHSGFLDAAAEASYTVTAVYLSASDAELERRCAARGSAQAAPWRAGRATKAARLRENIADHHQLLNLDGTADPADNVHLLTRAVPALAALPNRRPQ